VFVSTGGRHIHKAAFPGNPKVFAGILAGKILSFKANSKQIVFTEEIDGIFPAYNSCYAKAPLSPVLKADNNSIALLSDAM
jgi:hypothetical protein